MGPGRGRATRQGSGGVRAGGGIALPAGREQHRLGGIVRLDLRQPTELGQGDGGELRQRPRRTSQAATGLRNPWAWRIHRTPLGTAHLRNGPRDHPRRSPTPSLGATQLGRCKRQLDFDITKNTLWRTKIPQPHKLYRKSI